MSSGRSSRAFSRYLVFVILCVSGCAVGFLQPTSLSSHLDEDSFDWAKLEPSKELEWHDCYDVSTQRDGFKRQCARLIVPLNHADPDGQKAAVAITRIPSRLSKNSPAYRGPIIVNPGGPGESGVNMAVVRGPQLANIVGREFDIVGFDPRGVGRSTPKASFFKTAVEGALWEAAGSDVIDTRTDGLARAWGRAQILGHLAGNLEHETGELKYINTDQTARDMLHIVEAHGREKLQYWGFSYGTILGSTFATMFPDKVERMVIDGVADAEDYYATKWNNNLMDTDKAMQTFFDGCAEAGLARCAFSADTAADISKNLTTLYDKIRTNPVSVLTSLGTYGLVDYDRLRSTVFRSLAVPYAAFSLLAQGLADLAKGNGATLYALMEPPAFQCDCDLSKFPFEQVPDSHTAILCNDGKNVPRKFESTKKFFEDFYSVSTWAEIWANKRIGCTAWPRFDNEHFQGPVGSKTSFPLLLVGNTADPVTPLWAAKKTSQNFPGSVVLTQDSPGHGSIAAVSLCTQRYISQYFKKGTLPPVGTVCPVIGSLFPERRGVQAELDQSPFVIDDMGCEDRAMLDAVTELSSMFGPLSPPSL